MSDMRSLLSAVFLLLASAGLASGQDPLAAARELYASARYDEALVALDELRSARGQATADIRMVEQYRSLCLLALGRQDEAEAAIAAVVTADPFYLPGEAEASPRVRAAFRDVRRRVLPQIARERYAAAKAAYDRKEFAAAVDQFRDVVRLIDDPDMNGELGDLRVLAAGFLDLSAAAAAAAQPPPPPPEPEAPAPPPPAEPRVYQAGEPGLVPPVVLRQEIPRIAAPLLPLARSQGLLEIVIDERGRVESAVMRAPVHPVYDAQVLAAAVEWRYEPARLGGVPVKFRKRIQINVARREE
jgi:tetratricopeptide (TPR) repeat protein